MISLPMLCILMAVFVAGFYLGKWQQARTSHSGRHTSCLANESAPAAGQSIIAHIFAPGEYDAGIPDLMAAADIGLMEFCDPEDRQEIRKILKQAYDQILDGSTSIHFSDECVGCNEVLPNHKEDCWEVAAGERA